MVLFLPSASGIATGEAPAVGIRYFPATETHPPVRVYYPADCETKQPVGYFQETSASYFLQGYWSVLMARKRDTRLYQIGLWILKLVSWFLPLRYLKLPNVYQDAPIYTNSTTKFPLILFSHGLTGTGQENSVLLSAWAKQGFVVLSIHHTDGSSNRVTLSNGKDLWYDPGPPHKEYDIHFRPHQIRQRANELLQAREWFQETCETAWSSRMIDWDKTIVAGFSYGAATACLLAAKKGVLPSLQGVVLLDGWFHIDMRESAGIEFEFPKEAFEATHLKDIPALLINSEQFTRYSRLWASTKKIASQFATQQHVVLDKTNHNNFIDAVFWLPSGLWKKIGMIGEADVRQSYVDMVQASNEFLKTLQQDPWKTDPDALGDEEEEDDE